MSFITKVGALVKRYSTLEGEFCIDGDLFLNNFYALHRAEMRKYELGMAKVSKIMSSKRSKLHQQLDLFPKLLGR